MLNLFYEEPDPDRLLPFDRYPRRLLRRVMRGPLRIGGQRLVFLNLCAGLTRLGLPFRINDYRHARQHPDEPVGIVGKPFVLDKMAWQNPIVFGASVFSHPVDDPHLLTRLPIRKVLVPGAWMQRMWRPYYGDAVAEWPVGIDTDAWAPDASVAKNVDVLLYDKVRWNRDRFGPALIDIVVNVVRRRGLRVETLRYGAYEEPEFRELLTRTHAMVFLCEHETQGLAYQQALASGVPIYAWDQGEAWLDPSYYPHKVRFGPVSSVPYWDDRCGGTFTDVAEFQRGFDHFWSLVERGAYDPRAYVLENLTLEHCAHRYVELFTAATTSAAA